MAAKPLTTEAIALTEKKMDMTLDDIIKMSKKPTTKDKKAPRESNKGQGFLNGIAFQRGNQIQRFMDSRSSIRQGILAQRRSNFQGNQFPLTNFAARRAAFMPARNMAAMPARNMAAMPARNMAAMPARNTAANWNNKPRFSHVNAHRQAADGGVAVKDALVVHEKQQRPQTMDALFANMKEERMMVFSSHQLSYQDNYHPRFAGRQQQQTRGGARGGPWHRGGPLPGRRFGINNISIR